MGCPLLWSAIGQRESLISVLCSVQNVYYGHLFCTVCAHMVQKISNSECIGY